MCKDEVCKGGPEIDGHDAMLVRMCSNEEFGLKLNEELLPHNMDACSNELPHDLDACMIALSHDLDACSNACENELAHEVSLGANKSRGENNVNRKDLRPTCEGEIGPNSSGVANGPGVIILNHDAENQVMHPAVCDRLEAGNICEATKTDLCTSQVEGTETCAQSVSQTPEAVLETQIEDGDELQCSNPLPVSNASLLAEENLCEEPHEIAKSVWQLGLQLGVSGVLDETTMIAKLTDMESRDRKAIGRSPGS
ncbi:putative pecanex-like protein 1 [Sesbania bispinosa]|nr:putative pecanex-like protein 1 [Sesbania bispinosa]